MLKFDRITGQKLESAILESARLMMDNGVGDWKIQINNKRNILAETWHKDKTIAYSKHFLLVATKEQLVGVTLHEVTHAVLGKGHGHDSAFVRYCTKISPTPLYARRTADIPIRKYILTCPMCGYSGSNNVSKDRYCGICWKRGETIKFNIKENNLKVTVW